MNDLQDKIENQPTNKLRLQLKTAKTKLAQCRLEIRQMNGHYMKIQLDKKRILRDLPEQRPISKQLNFDKFEILRNKINENLNY